MKTPSISLPKLKHCPICSSSKVVGDRNSFYCKKCGFSHSSSKKAQIVEFN